MNQKTNKKIKITLVKSPIGCLAKHKACLASLGLKRIRQSVEHYASDSIMGMVNKINYLLKVEEL